MLTQLCAMELLGNTVFIQAMLPMSFQEKKDNALQTLSSFAIYLSIMKCQCIKVAQITAKVT